MRFLLFILFFSLQASGQMYFGRIASNGGSTPEPPPPANTRYIINENFDGTSLSSTWSQRRANKQTVIVGGGVARVIGNADTVPAQIGYFYRNKSMQLINKDTGYGFSMIRNYVIETKGRVNKVNDTTVGIYVGVRTEYIYNSYSVFDYSVPNDTLDAINVEDTAFHRRPSGYTINALSNTVQTGDSLLLRMTVYEDSFIAFIKNITRGDSGTAIQIYPSNFAGLYPMRPNYFNYCFGVMGRTDFSFDYFRVWTTEILNPDLVFIGNSITTGYAASDLDSNWAYMLRRYTNRTIQVMAGAGNTVLSTIKCLPEIYTVSPDTVFLNLGTNSGGTTADYSRLTDSLIAHGIFVYHTLTVNGGNPATGSTWNNYIATTYPTTYVDTWTTGWNTMSTGNGEMVDPVHPSITGVRKIMAIIRDALPSIFDL